MKVQDTVLDGVKIIEPVVYGDNRGFFLEVY
ncbi:dTDP-4-dehydrorhamnose 3,5-epimerase, partial [Shigella boydii]|nr:dTDP-4-dehydrorhamnose 3,5-epimerase [Shigella boydii]